MPCPAPTDYAEAIQNPGISLNDPELKAACPEVANFGLPRAISGNFAVVFPMASPGRKWAIRCFTTYHQDQEERYKAISEHLGRIRNPHMVDFKFQPQGVLIRGTWHPILKMEWVEGHSLIEYIRRNLSTPEHIFSLAQAFLALTADLRKHCIAHGDLQHGNILISQGRIRLIDYDGMFVPSLAGRGSHELGHENYQHPRRTAHEFGPNMDNFASLVIFLSLVAISIDPTVFNVLNEGEEFLIFRRSDFERPSSSQAFGILETCPAPLVQSLCSTLRLSLDRSDLCQIPSLDPAIYRLQQRPQVPSYTQPVVSVGGIVSRPWYQGEQLSPAHAGYTARGASGAGAAWVPVALGPLPEKTLAMPVLQERIIALFCVLATVLAVILFVLGAVPFAAAFPFSLVALIIMFTILGARYRSLEEFSEKAALLTEVKQIEKDDRSIAGEIKEQMAARHKAQAGLDCVTKAQKSAEQEHQAGARRNEDMLRMSANNSLSLLAGRRADLTRRRDEMIITALEAHQKNYIETQLNTYRLSSANIKGIGPKLQQALIAKGIQTAADIIDWVPFRTTRYGRYTNTVAYVSVRGKGRVQIPGIGPVKADALLDWRKGVEARVRAGAASALPNAHRAAIEADYQNHLQRVETEENKVRLQLRQAIAASKTQADSSLRLQLAKLRETEKRFAEALGRTDRSLPELQKKKKKQEYWLAHKKRELDAYRPVTFLNYCRLALAIWNSA